MLTRTSVAHAYTPSGVPRTNTAGAMVDRPTGAFNNKNNIVARMPIARPNSSPAPEGAPFYIEGYRAGNGPLMHGGAMTMTPVRPRLEMDPSDPASWQRQYRFT